MDSSWIYLWTHTCACTEREHFSGTENLQDTRHRSLGGYTRFSGFIHKLKHLLLTSSWDRGRARWPFGIPQRGFLLFSQKAPLSPTVWTLLIHTFLMSTLWSFGKKTRRRRRLYRKALKDGSRQQGEHLESICWMKGAELWKRMKEKGKQEGRREPGKGWQFPALLSTSQLEVMS